jgi:hypothetical protein
MSSPVPAEGRLKFSGRVYLGEATTGTAVLMSSYSYPPSTITDFIMPLYKMADKGKWLPVQGDLAATGEIPDIGRWEWGGPDNGRYLDNVNIRLNGQKGDRVVIYLDDFQVEGEVTVRAEYAKEVDRRWAPTKERVEHKAAKFDKDLAKSAKDIESINAITEYALQVKKESLEKISEFARSPGR